MEQLSLQYVVSLGAISLQFVRQSAKQSASAAFATKGRHTVDIPEKRAARRETIGLLERDATISGQRRGESVLFISDVSRFRFTTARR